mmetsp:Transcript_27077/g.72673  ORF Transcript_27077/g.72673 Transcript_27077/m.72673 type:complete len:247 (-) Transcript_27077:174-914(-)
MARPSLIWAQVRLGDFLPEWLSSLLMSTLPLDVSGRVWDCYLRDGELFLWRAILELLRLLAPLALKADEREACLECLRHARHVPACTEKGLFHSIGSNEAAMLESLADFSQKLPMPSAERGGGTCFDMWRNATLAGIDDRGAEPPDDDDAHEPEGDPNTGNFTLSSLRAPIETGGISPTCRTRNQSEQDEYSAAEHASPIAKWAGRASDARLARGAEACAAALASVRLRTDHVTTIVPQNCHSIWA